MKLLKGTLDVMILQSLTNGPLHGYAVVEWIRASTRGELQVEEGALYTALHRMAKQRWVKAEWGASENNRRAKFYHLTAAGEAELARASASWRKYATAMERILEGGAG